MDHSTRIRKLAAAYAEAVYFYARSGHPLAISESADGFEVDTVEDGTTPDDVDLWIGTHWRQFAPGIVQPDLIDDAATWAEFQRQVADAVVACGAAAQLLKRFTPHQGLH